MERISLSPDISLSRLVYGLWRLGDDPDRSPAHVRAKIEACLEQKIESFDQADIYGNYESESLLGAALRGAPDLRRRMEIITKCDICLVSDKYPARRIKYYDTSRAHIFASVEDSLRKMSIEQIDLLLIHRPDPLMDHEETGRALDDLIAQGKIRAAGVSNFKAYDWDLLQSAMSARLATNQIELGLLAHEAFTNGDLAFLQERRIAPMAWSPLAGGRLMGAGAPAALTKLLKEIADAQGVGPESVAVAWLLKHPARIIPVLGTNDLGRIRRISEALRVALSREDWFRLYEAARGREVA